MFKKFLLVLLLGLVVIQFIHPPRNKAAGAQPNYMGNVHAIPTDVKAILSKACNDCHSNNTAYPWYARIQPVHWWLDGHIRNGKKHLNFDEYTNRSLRYQFHKMEETVEMVEDGTMPLKSYTWTHKDAKLTQEEKKKLIAWSQSVMEAMKTRYPLDSLVRKN